MQEAFKNNFLICLKECKWLSYLIQQRTQAFFEFRWCLIHPSGHNWNLDKIPKSSANLRRCLPKKLSIYEAKDEKNKRSSIKLWKETRAKTDEIYGWWKLDDYRWRQIATQIQPIEHPRRDIITQLIRTQSASHFLMNVCSEINYISHPGMRFSHDSLSD